MVISSSSKLFCRAFLLLHVLTSIAQPDGFPTVYNSEVEINSGPPTPQQSLSKLQLPPNFKATVFAAEPDVQNPIAMAWDARGRLWIAENYTYAEKQKRFDTQLRDRLLIFEDKDNDGQFDKRLVFTDDVQYLTSVEIGHGGVWALCPPQLLYFADKNGDDKPDGPAEVVLDGFTVPAANYHNFANGLRWGPDGWLYGRCGASAPGKIGIPGRPDAERLPIHGGIWRYHPRRKLVEVLTAGPMNSWGHDWNEHGELFCCNTVTGHLWHVIPGAHYHVAHTLDPNRHVYQLLDMHADHWHFDTGQGWTNSRDGNANSYGGGHAHAGAMVYLGNNWPSTYRGRLYTLNLFGRRANQEILERHGSGYVAKHGNDCLLFGDEWFRGIDLGYGPDGGVFVLDWSDTGECHESTGVHRTSGRVYKITYGAPEIPAIRNLGEASIAQLVQLHRHANEWFVRQARIQLSSRGTRGKEFDDARDRLQQLFADESDPALKIRAMCSLYAIGGADDSFLHAQLTNPDEHVRVWAIRMLSDLWPLDSVISRRPIHSPAKIDDASLNIFVGMAKSDASNLVRLALATLLQRLPVAQRPALAAALLSSNDITDDHNLPLMIWYGLIAVGKTDPESLVMVAANSRVPLVRRLIARRLAEDIEIHSKPLNDLLATATASTSEYQNDVLAGLAEALQGWSKAEKPSAWDSFQSTVAQSGTQAMRERLRALNVLFGDGRSLDEVRRVALDDSTPLEQRRAALETLVASNPGDLRQICEKLLTVRWLNSTAVKGLAQFDDPAIGEKLAKSYSQFAALERPAVMDALTSRPSFTRPLLEEIAAGTIPRADMTPFQARRVRSFQNDALNDRLIAVWGQLRDAPAEKQRAIAEWKAELRPSVMEVAEKSNGRKVFNRTCATCHRLYGYGDPVGLDLTGSSRNNLNFLLDNIIDPSGVVNADFQMRIVLLADGRTLNGLIASQSERTITLKMQSETVVIDRSQIDEMEVSKLSLMPEGLLDSLTRSDARDLIAYLMHPIQVPLSREK